MNVIDSVGISSCLSLLAEALGHQVAKLLKLVGVRDFLVSKFALNFIKLVSVGDHEID